MQLNGPAQCICYNFVKVNEDGADFKSAFSSNGLFHSQFLQEKELAYCGTWISALKSHPYPVIHCKQTPQDCHWFRKGLGRTLRTFNFVPFETWRLTKVFCILGKYFSTRLHAWSSFPSLYFFKGGENIGLRI